MSRHLKSCRKSEKTASSLFRLSLLPTGSSLPFGNRFSPLAVQPTTTTTLHPSPSLPQHQSPDLILPAFLLRRRRRRRPRLSASWVLSRPQPKSKPRCSSVAPLGYRRMMERNRNPSRTFPCLPMGRIGWEITSPLRLRDQGSHLITRNPYCLRQSRLS